MLDDADKHLQLLATAADPPAHPLAVAATLWLLANIVADGQPTPQIYAGPRIGSVAVTWLVNGYEGNLVVDTDRFEMWAENPKGREIFSHESSASRADPQRKEYINRLRRWLMELGRQIPKDAPPPGIIQR